MFLHKNYFIRGNVLNSSLKYTFVNLFEIIKILIKFSFKFKNNTNLVIGNQVNRYIILISVYIEINIHNSIMPESFVFSMCGTVIT